MSIERKKKLCKGPCGQMKFIWARGMCQECDRKENPSAPVQRTTTPLKRTRIRVKRKVTGEWALFEEIWQERPHKCQCCPQHLGNVMQAHFFSHLLGKGAYPSLRLVKKNIMLKCPTCHREWETGDRNQEKFKLARLICQKLKLEYYEGRNQGGHDSNRQSGTSDGGSDPEQGA